MENPYAEAGAPPPVRSPRWFWLPGLLGLVLLLPFYLERLQGVVEKLEYASTRGRQRALSEDAKARLASLEDTSGAFRLVAISLAPSVVQIDTLRPPPLSLVPLKDGSLPATGEEPSDEPAPREQMQATGQGSGVIVDESGYILTNYHVIEEASQVQVRLGDGRTVAQAVVVGVDPLTDLAVIKIDGGGYTSATWGDSRALEVGDWVLAVGNPFGLDRSVSAGIVSAKRRRQIVRNMAFQDFLQTDASVNPGSSGGPLVNLKGEVVGINTAIVGQEYQGISFAIPSSIARDVYERLKTGGKVVRGWLGVALAEVESQETKGIATKPAGAVVKTIFPGSPAEEAGLKPGDVIIEWDSQPIADHTDLSMFVARTPIGAVSKVLLHRGDETLTIEVKVGQRPGHLVP